MSEAFPLAPALRVNRWFNTAQPITLEALRGRVVALHAFQMLCPGCVSHGLPQAARLAQVFAPHELAVIGLHTVFEHHQVMTAQALEAFIHEYRLSFPIGVDQAAPDGDIPLTMRALDLRGTPSLILLDKRGRIRLNHFGRLDDMALGAIIGRLACEEVAMTADAGQGTADAGRGTDRDAARASQRDGNAGDAARTPPQASGVCDDSACRMP